MLSLQRIKVVSLVMLVSVLFLVCHANAQASEGFGLIMIREDGSIQCDSIPSSASGLPIQQEGEVYTLTDNIKSRGPGISILRSGITIDGAGYTLEGMTCSAGDGAEGLAFSSDVEGVTVKNLHITNFATGIHLSDNSGNTFVGNNVSDNLHNGFYFFGSCCNNTLSQNTIANNPRWGVIFVGREVPYGFPASGNEVFNNVIENNGWERQTVSGYGMEDDYGAGVWLWVAVDNLFYGNKFVSNAQQVFVFDNGTNVWSKALPVGGNYWSDYSGVDADEDGIGDSQYIIDNANYDSYPLFEQAPEEIPSETIPSETDENEQTSQFPLEYIIGLIVAFGCIVLLAFVILKRKQTKQKLPTVSDKS